MPKSKVNKARKQKVLKYKKSKKMSKLPTEQKPFRQVPTWKSDDTFEIQGTELDSLYNFFNIFAPAFTSIQQIFSRGIQSGKISMNYEYEDGTPVSASEVEDYTKRLQEYFKEKQAELAKSQAEPFTEAPQPNSNTSDDGAKVVSLV